ncbi:hypothetical protein XENOCAPTIV_006952, partial [Xenoophorus captivus]
DTGCPTSQSVSPSKTPSGSERSPHGSPTLPECKTKVKRVRLMAASGGEACSAPRHKRELRSALRARENEIGELKAQLCRMREDWIEEECHRVEAQLSLKEARKEIRQLRQVVETMKNSLMEKDKGIQKYFIDINIQNRKLESLLHSMELAQSGSTLQDEGALDFMYDRSEGDKKLLGEEESGMELVNAGAEAMADSGLLVNDEMANREDIFEQIFISNAVDFSQDSVSKPKSPVESGAEKPAVSEEEQLVHASTPPPASPPVGLSSTVTISSSPSYHQNTDKEVQTDLLPISPDLQALLLQLLKFHGASLGDAALTAPSSLLDFPILPTSKSTVDQSGSERSQPSILVGGPNTSTDTSSSDLTKSSRFMEELDFGVQEEKPFESASKILVDKSYWSSNFLVDLVAVAAPVLPTVAWLYSRHGVDGSTPVYNIGALIRGCCIMGLHSLRHVTRRPNT